MKQIALIITISFLFFGNNTHTMHPEATSYWQKDLAVYALVGFGLGLGLSYLGLSIFTNNKKILNQTQNTQNATESNRLDHLHGISIGNVRKEMQLGFKEEKIRLEQLSFSVVPQPKDGK